MIVALQNKIYKVTTEKLLTVEIKLEADELLTMHNTG